MRFKTEKKKGIKKKQVKCETCKHWVDRSDCQEVLVRRAYYYFGWTRSVPSGLEERGELYYCPMHKVPYDIIQHEDERDVYFVKIPATEKEVGSEKIKTN